MTRRQEVYWRKEMIKLEQSLLRYYRDNAGEGPDGSFMMSAFKAGYYTSQRIERKRSRHAD